MMKHMFINEDLGDGKKGNRTFTFQWLNSFLRQHHTLKFSSLQHMEKAKTDAVTLEHASKHML